MNFYTLVTYMHFKSKQSKRSSCKKLSDETEKNKEFWEEYAFPLTLCNSSTEKYNRTIPYSGDLHDHFIQLILYKI